MAHCSVALLGTPSDVGVRPGRPGHAVSCAPSGLAASWGVETLVSNDLLAVRALTPVTCFSLRLTTRAGRPRGGDPIYPTACCAGPVMQRAASTSTPTAA